jgi:hypothetical protein
MSNFYNFNDTRGPSKQARVVATSNLASTGTQVIDGVTVIDGDPVLLTAQTSGANNGLFVVAPNHWQRHPSALLAEHYRQGMRIHVAEGTAEGGGDWRLATAGPYTLGTTALTFERTATTDLTGNDADTFVNAVIAVANATGGATATTLSLTLTRLDCTVAIYCSDTQYANGIDANSNITLDTVTSGSIVGSVAAAGFFLAKTTTGGVFACNANNSVDETVWFNVTNPVGGIDALAAGTYVRGCVPDSAAWSA